MRNNFVSSACFDIFLLVILSGRWMEWNKDYGMKWMGQITPTRRRWWLLDMNTFFWSCHLNSQLAKPISTWHFLACLRSVVLRTCLLHSKLPFLFSLNGWHKRNCYLQKERIKLVVNDLKIAVYPTDHSGLLLVMPLPGIILVCNHPLLSYKGLWSHLNVVIPM